MSDYVPKMPAEHIEQLRRWHYEGAEDGGIFSFGSANFHGSLGDRPPARPVTSAAVLA